MKVCNQRQPFRDLASVRRQERLVPSLISVRLTTETVGGVAKHTQPANCGLLLREESIGAVPMWDPHIPASDPRREEEPVLNDAHLLYGPPSVGYEDRSCLGTDSLFHIRERGAHSTEGERLFERGRSQAFKSVERTEEQYTASITVPIMSEKRLDVTEELLHAQEDFEVSSGLIPALPVAKVGWL
jgi:hypothetical protein